MNRVGQAANPTYAMGDEIQLSDKKLFSQSHSENLLKYVKIKKPHFKSTNITNYSAICFCNHIFSC